jgi:hypothetical protein
VEPRFGLRYTFAFSGDATYPLSRWAYFPPPPPSPPPPPLPLPPPPPPASTLVLFCFVVEKARPARPVDDSPPPVGPADVDDSSRHTEGTAAFPRVGRTAPAAGLLPLDAAVQVAFGKSNKDLKPGYHVPGSRVETRWSGSRVETRRFPFSLFFPALRRKENQRNLKLRVNWIQLVQPPHLDDGLFVPCDASTALKITAEGLALAPGWSGTS